MAEGSLSSHIVTNAVMVEMEFENNFFLLLGSPVSVADLNFVFSSQPLHAFTRCSCSLPLIQRTLLHQALSPADTAAVVYIRVRLLPVPGSFKRTGGFL